MKRNITVLIVIVLIIGVYFIGKNSNKTSSDFDPKSIGAVPVVSQLTVPLSDGISLQAQCATQGQAFFLKFRASADTGIETTWQPPEYHFNTRLQTCLMAWQDGGLVGSDNQKIDIESGGVIDILENKEILGDVNVHGGWEEYIQKKNVLMSE